MRLFHFDDVILLEVLGKGGFGKVTKAYHKRKCDYIAIKEFLHSSQENEGFLDSVLSEHSLLKQIESLSKKNPWNQF